MIRPLIPALGVAAASALLLSSACVSEASAQTPLGNQGRQVSKTPPGKTPNQAAGPATAEAPSVPMPESVVKQAERQLEGNFPAMARSGVGGQVQDAWNDAGEREGVHTFRLCEDCVYKVRVREFMATTIILPEDARIADIDLGDPAGFQFKVKAANKVAVRPASYGMDTNLNVYTQTGAVYPFYLRAESFNSKNVPDVVVKILGRETEPTVESQIAALPASPEGERQEEKKGPEEPGDGPDKPEDKAKAAVEALTNPKADDGDFVRSIPFDPSELHGWNAYKLWGDESLRPETVFQDGQFTYIQYGGKWDAVELPTAYVVIDDIDELVNSRVKGSTLIVESVAPLITLKSGKQFLCVQYTGGTRS